ncbi:putative glycerol kinase 5 [Paramacrobiotus metropolitanus]|uniref:putative glycerol kinase 5 n=1 Tax=Paramacrobiotus metropolitanus TaxID=2943436 RepID=UPI0024463124|nr:putative glycerol kinase 5 [Paramacrobiotus metropolitanus]
MAHDNPGYILILDIGSTFIKCAAFSIVESDANTMGEKVKEKSLAFVGISRQPTPTVHNPQLKSFEIDPEILFSRILAVIEQCLADYYIDCGTVACMGITSQRGTFLTCDAISCQPYQPFISWKDGRAVNIAQTWSHSFVSRCVRLLGKGITTVVDWNRAIIMSAIYFRPNHILPRLGWSIRNVPGLKQAIKDKEARLTLLDSWVLRKFTNGKSFKVDYSMISCTGLFNPATKRYSRPLLWVFNIPRTVLPEVVPTVSKQFGHIDENYFGFKRPISCMVADQQAAAFGHFLVQPGDAKLTIGTGCFLNVNSGGKLVFDLPNNIYTIIGWTLDHVQSSVYLTETQVDEFSRIVTQCFEKDLGLEQCREFPAAIGSLPYFLDRPWVFVSAEGNVVPEDDIPLEVQRYLVLEALAFKIVFRIVLVNRLVHVKYPLRVDGGLSSLSLMLKIVATLVNGSLERSTMTEMTSFGAALLAGMGAGFWDLRDVERMTAAVPKESIVPEEQWRTALAQRQALSQKLSLDFV